MTDDHTHRGDDVHSVEAAEREDNGGWQPIETAPYEVNVLTFWGGNEMRNPKIIVNTKNGGLTLGRRDLWWCSLPDQQPTHWMPLPAAPTEGKHLTPSEE
jgi:hypothetical protein